MDWSIDPEDAKEIPWVDSSQEWKVQPMCLEDIEREMKIVLRAYLLDMPN